MVVNMKILPLFFIFLGFISAFSLSEHLPIPMILAVFLSLNLLRVSLKRKELAAVGSAVSFSLYSFILILLISLYLQINSIGFNTKGITHTLSYIVVLAVYYMGVELYLKTQRIELEKVYKYISIGVILVATFTLIEFVCKNFLNINFDQYIYRPSFQYFNATYHNGQFIRARGTAEESGHIALYMMMFLPFVIYYYKGYVKSTFRLIISTVTILTAVIVTFSATAFLEIIVASMLILLYYSMKKVRRGFSKLEYLLMYLVFSIGIGIGIFLLYSGYKLVYLQGVFNKITFNNSASGNSRLERWDFALDLIKDSPLIGHGAGFVAILNGTGSTNMYLEIMTATGILGFLCIVVILFRSLYLALTIPGHFKLVYLYSFIVMSIHMFVISQYWLPWIWTLLAVINYHASIVKSTGFNAIVHRKVTTNLN